MTIINNSGLTSRISEFQAKVGVGELTTQNIAAFMESVMRDAYDENVLDLAFYAKKVKFYNTLKKAMRDELTRLRTVQSELAPYYNDDGSVDLAAAQAAEPPNHTDGGGTDYSGQNNPNWGASQDGQGGLRRWADEQLRTCWGDGGVAEFSDIPGPDGEVQAEMGLGADKWWTAGGKDRLDNAIEGLEEQFNGVGDDAQMANVDLQNKLQKMQQTLQTISNISKMLHDTSMAIIRKIG